MLAEGARVASYELTKALDTTRREVWLARGPSGAHAVVRMLPAQSPEHARILDSLVLEARTISHPRLAPIVDAGLSDGTRFVVAQRIDGLDLSRAAALRPRPAFEVAALVVLEAARVWRDVSPKLSAAGTSHGALALGSLVGTPKGDLLLVDLLSRQVATGVRLAPELFVDQPPTEKTDVFLLTAALFELVTGSPPFDLAAMPGSFGPLSLPDQTVEAPRALWSLLERGLSIEPAARLPALEQLIQALTLLVDDEILARDAFTDWLAARPKAMTELDPAALGGEADRSSNPFFDPARDVESPHQNLNFGSRFKVLGRLGEGGMGEVYRVEDTELDEVVALKIISRKASDPDVLARLRREVRLARSIVSPRVCRIHDLVELDGGTRGVTMAYLRGKTLHALTRSGLPVDYRRYAKWGADIAEGLAAAHALGIVHRDLKPENVMVLDADDRAVILDFGIAVSTLERRVDRLTDKGIILGTLPYMAPEQLVDDQLDGRADLYALGLILGELITGEIPLIAKTYKDILEKRVIRPERFDVARFDAQTPTGLAKLIEAMLEPKRANRPASAEVVARALRECEADLSAATTKVPRGDAAPSFLLASGSAELTSRSAQSADAPRGNVSIELQRPWALGRAAPALVVAGALAVGLLAIGRQRSQVAPAPPDAGLTKGAHELIDEPRRRTAGSGDSGARDDESVDGGARDARAPRRATRPDSPLPM